MLIRLKYPGISAVPFGRYAQMFHNKVLSSYSGPTLKIEAEGSSESLPLSTTLKCTLHI